MRRPIGPYESASCSKRNHDAAGRAFSYGTAAIPLSRHRKCSSASGMAATMRRNLEIAMVPGRPVLKTSTAVVGALAVLGFSALQGAPSAHNPLGWLIPDGTATNATGA